MICDLFYEGAKEDLDVFKKTLMIHDGVKCENILVTSLPNRLALSFKIIFFNIYKFLVKIIFKGFLY